MSSAYGTHFVSACVIFIDAERGGGGGGDGGRVCVWIM